MTEIPASMQTALGRIVPAEDVVTAAPVAALMATFGHDDPHPAEGDALPPLWHGLFCTAKLPPSRLGPDGLAKDEGLLPAAPDFPNKLFGGARFTFHHPLRIGEAIRKESEVMSFEVKEGRSGPFIVGVVQHRLYNAAGLAVTEENDILFRPGAAAGGGSPAPRQGTARDGKPHPAADAAWTETIAPNSVLMFRHSAVTFNSHRIHYDRDYVRERGYPGLLVQGTLIARLMLERVRREYPGRDVTAFRFRSGRPIYDTGDFAICGGPGEADGTVWLRALDQDGAVGMAAEAQLTPQ